MVQFRKNNILYLLVSILWDNLQNPDIIEHCFSTLAAIIVEDGKLLIHSFYFFFLKESVCVYSNRYLI